MHTGRSKSTGSVMKTFTFIRFSSASKRPVDRRPATGALANDQDVPHQFFVLIDEPTYPSAGPPEVSAATEGLPC